MMVTSSSDMCLHNSLWQSIWLKTYLILLYTSSSAISRPSLLYVVSTKTRTLGSILNLASDLWSCAWVWSDGDLFSVWQWINGIGFVSRFISLQGITEGEGEVIYYCIKYQKLFIMLTVSSVKWHRQRRSNGFSLYTSDVSMRATSNVIPSWCQATRQIQSKRSKSNGTCFI